MGRKRHLGFATFTVLRAVKRGFRYGFDVMDAPPASRPAPPGAISVLVAGEVPGNDRFRLTPATLCTP